MPLLSPVQPNPVRQQRHLTVHTALTVPPVRVMQSTREYLVCPCIMVVEGVLNGGLVSGVAIAACHWDGVPIVLGHPLDADGSPVSANDPAILATQGLGHVYRTHCRAFQQGTHTLTRAHAELWLDIAQVEGLGNEGTQVLQQLESQTPLEVSTAFFCETERTVGTFYGVPYTEVHHNLHADHLALLPQGIGACSWQDGCGAPRLNNQAACEAGCACTTCTERSAMELPSPTTWQTFLSAMQKLFAQSSPPEGPKPEPEREPPSAPELSVNRTEHDIRQALYSALALEMGTDYTTMFIESIDTSNQSFTYSQGERLLMRSWEMVGDVLTLVEDAQDVQRDTRYIPVTQQQQEVPTMTTSPVAIKARVNALIANERTRWTEPDRHMLEAQDEAFLIRLEQQPLDVPPPLNRQPETVHEAIATMPQHLQEPMQAMAQEYESRKTAAIAVLVANKTCPFSQDELQTMTAQRLEQLVMMAGEEVPLRPGQQVVKEVRVRDFSGRGLPHVRLGEDELPPPTPDTFAKVVELQKARGILPS